MKALRYSPRDFLILLIPISALEFIGVILALAFSGAGFIVFYALAIVSFLLFFWILNLLIFARIRTGKWPDVVSATVALCNSENHEEVKA